MDLYNLQNIKPVINSFKFGKPYYNFYNNIISFIDPTKLNIKNDKYGYLYFYLMDKYELLNIIINTENILDTLNNIIRVKNNEFGDYQQIHVNKYTSKTNKHRVALENLNTTNDREKYLIENKLDKYFKIFNPINKFYEKSIKSKILDIDFYYSTYFYNIKQRKIVKEYLKGLKWILEYYYIRKNINNYWHYKFKKTPLFKTIIKYYNPKYIAFNFEKKEIDLLPYEQLLYIIPKPSEDDLNMLFPNEYMNKIKIFIKKYPEYFLDNITHLEGMFDCSNSLYVNKCDCLILEKIINIKKFVKKLRNI
jgi:5'-3' exonuclease